MCGRQIAKKAVRVLHLILDYHQRSESSIVRGSGGVALKKQSHKKWCVGRKKEITVALMRTRASGAISSEL